jgi:acyl-coenzyme A thioesterase PaaI-like protein
MPLSWLFRLPVAWRPLAVKLGFNFHPAFRGTGGRVVAVSPDLRRMRVRLPLSWRTRNVVGTLFGGSLFAVTDGPHPTMLMMALGRDYVVWDKAATIRFRKPGREALYADMTVTSEEIADIRAALAKAPEVDRDFVVELKDRQGVVHAVVERTVYVADKNYYTQKVEEGGSS